MNFSIDSQPNFKKPPNYELESNLHKLWDFDSIGIRPVDKVQESVLEDVSFTGQRYSVGLPRKIVHKPLPCEL